jgi:flagellar basal-body rod modification protein FlgD
MQILSTLAAHQSQPHPTQPGLSQPNTSQSSPRATTASGTSGGTTTPPANSPDQLTSQSTFLQLLVAQIKNQDPLNPTDSIQFVGQLVQFSQLEQLLSINQGVTALAKGNQPATPSATPQPTRNGS